MGRDLLRELGIKLDFENDLIEYQHVAVPMRTFQQFSSGEESHFFEIDEPQAIQDTTERVKKMLDHAKSMHQCQPNKLANKAAI
jgi:hypothetical protein